MGSHNAGGRRHPRSDEAKERRILALLDGQPVLGPEPDPQWRTRPDEVKLHVSNLSYDADENDLRELFRDCGWVSLHLFRDSFSGKSRGFAVVKVMGKAAADKALALDGCEWNGRILKIHLWERP